MIVAAFNALAFGIEHSANGEINLKTSATLAAFLAILVASIAPVRLASTESGGFSTLGQSGSAGLTVVEGDTVQLKDKT